MGLRKCLAIMLHCPHYVAIAQGLQKSDHVVDLCVGPGRRAIFLPRQRLVNHIEVAAARNWFCLALSSTLAAELPMR
jgi:hypothetical protein